MTPQEAYEWISVAVSAGLALARVLTALGGVAWAAMWAWDEWRKNR